MPRDVTVVGVDWSGARDAWSKIWGATLTFDADAKPTLVALVRPLAADATDPTKLVDWVHAQSFDVAGFDFCFGVATEQLARLDRAIGSRFSSAPEVRPNEIGALLTSRSKAMDADAFRSASAPEGHRVTDERMQSPFRPTNLRMYRQTYWGLRLLGSLQSERYAFVPWDVPSPGKPVVVEVLPRNVVRWLVPDAASYKAENVVDRPACLSTRMEILRDVKEATRLRFDEKQSRAIADDHEGDALDAVLAALAAAHALASGFPRPDDLAAARREGWIYGV